MSESFFDKMFGKKPKKDEKPAPAPAPAADAANGLKFLANPKKATNKRIEDAEKTAGLKCGGRVKKLAFGGSTGMTPRPMLRSMPAPVPGRPMVRPMPTMRGPMPPGPIMGSRVKPGDFHTQPVERPSVMKKGGSVRGGGCATKGIGKGKMR